MTDHDIGRAVISLRAKFPLLTVDGLCPDNWEPEQKPLELVMLDTFRLKHHIPPCVEWLQRCRFRQRFNLKSDTYTYKHEVEALAGHWISHMSMLVAVELQGLEMRQCSDRTWAGELKICDGRPGQPKY